mmetsp:Transcript_12813/g.20727  ORF Transcript_12813/g.20727 Transcript_12813/m.20727 type:complete len:86 (+) Transcript_12813:511-768(+)
MLTGSVLSACLGSRSLAACSHEVQSNVLGRQRHHWYGKRICLYARTSRQLFNLLPVTRGTALLVDLKSGKTRECVASKLKMFTEY